MIPWADDTPMHEPDRAERCWGDRKGEECGEPSSTSPVGLCGDCLCRLTGERPMHLVPTPPSPSYLTGAGRR